jgi:hypothetical protein
MTWSLRNAVSFALDSMPDPETEAMRLFHHLRDRFGWAGTIFTRMDVESRVERTITDDEWEAVKDTKYWTDMPSVLCEGGAWDIVDDAIREAGLQSCDTHDEPGCLACGDVRCKRCDSILSLNGDTWIDGEDDPTCPAGPLDGEAHEPRLEESPDA